MMMPVLAKRMKGENVSFPAIGLEWADFKYGHPHKLYITHTGKPAHAKFHVTHLLELPDETFKVVAEALDEKTSVLFERDESGTKWSRRQ
jgi:hypothetical protein